MSVAFDDVVPTAVSDYEVVRLLHLGNNGRYFLARPPARLGLDEEFVMLKVFGSCSERAYDLSVQELRMSTSVNSPHLLQVYDAVLTDSFALAIEYCPLGSLAAPTRALNRAEQLTVLRDAARGAHALHEAGLAHSDIRPGNIVLDQQDGVLVGKLSDLGLARFLDPGLTLNGLAGVDALEFLDPDILGGARPSRATEIWSLGASIHRSLTETGIYGDLDLGSPILAIRRILTREPDIDPRLSAPEAAVVRDCLAPAQARLATAAQVAERLDSLLGS